MRLAVLFCGILSGIFALSFGWWGQTDNLLHVAPDNQALKLAVVLAIQPIGLAALLGGAAVIFFPAAARAALFSSAVGWLALVAVIGGGMSLPVAVLILLSAGGGLLSFLPSVREPMFRLARAGEGAPQNSRPAPRRAEAQRPNAEPDRRKSLPSVAAEPRLTAARAPMRRGKAPGRAGGDRERRGPYEFSYVPARAGRSPSPRRRTSWQSTALGLVVLAALVVGVPLALVLDARDHGSSPAVATVADAQIAPHAAPRVRSSSVQVDEERLPAGEFGPSQAPDIQPPAAVESRPASSDEFASLPPLTDLPSTSAGSAEPPAPAVPLTSSAAAPPMLPASPLFVRYATPFDYCAATGDIDIPDTSGIGSGLPEQLVTGVRQVTKLPDGEVVWRCMQKEVWVCAQPKGGVLCGKVPTDAKRIQYCVSHPGAPVVTTAGGPWRCNGINPALSPSQQNIADLRGFDRTAWLGISTTPVAPGTSG